MYIELGILAIIIIYVMQYVGGFSINKFVDDNAGYFKRLQEDDYQNRLAWGIYNGIMDYFN